MKYEFKLVDNDNLETIVKSDHDVVSWQLLADKFYFMLLAGGFVLNFEALAEYYEMQAFSYENLLGNQNDQS